MEGELTAADLRGYIMRVFHEGVRERLERGEHREKHNEEY